MATSGSAFYLADKGSWVADGGRDVHPCFGEQPDEAFPQQDVVVQDAYSHGTVLGAGLLTQSSLTLHHVTISENRGAGIGSKQPTADPTETGTRTMFAFGLWAVGRRGVDVFGGAVR